MERVTSVSETVAEGLTEVAFRVVQVVRREVRRRRPSGLSISQLRALSLLSREAGASLADVAEHAGLGAPAASRMVEELVRNTLVLREPAAGDRRRLALRLSPAGARALRLAQSVARRPLSARLERLSAQERSKLSEAVTILRQVLAATGTPPSAAGEFDDE